MANKLIIDDVNNVLEALSSIKSKWEVLGLQIGVHADVLDGFKQQYGRNPDDCLLAVLKDHLKKIEPVPSWDGFVKALRSESVRETALAEKLAAKYCQSTPAIGAMQLSEPKISAFHSELQEPLLVDSTDGAAASETSDAPGPGPAISKSVAVCITPPADQNQFPYLKLPEEMSEDARETFYGRLSTENREIQLKFQNLVNKTMESLNERKITARQLSSKLMCCSTYEPQIGNSKKLLLDCLDEIRNQESIDDAFFMMRTYFSFFNYELIKHIIHAFSLEETDLLNYEKELKVFCERRVYEFPKGGYGTLNNTSKRLVVQLDSEFAKFTMNSLRNFRYHLCEILEISCLEVQLLEVKQACIEIVFAIPSKLVDDIFPLSEVQKKTLQDERVKSLLLVENLLTVKGSERTTNAVQSEGQRAKSEEQEEILEPVQPVKTKSSTFSKSVRKLFGDTGTKKLKSQRSDQEDKEFRICLAEMAHNLNQQEADEIVYIEGLPAGNRGTSPLAILCHLQMAGVFSRSDIDGLVQVLKHINRYDLVDKVKKYVAKSLKRKKRTDEEYSHATHVMLEARLEALIIHNISLQDQLAKFKEDVKEAGKKRVEEVVVSVMDTVDTFQVDRKLRQAKALLHNSDYSPFTSDEQHMSTLPRVRSYSCSEVQVSHQTLQASHRSRANTDGSNSIPRPSRPLAKPKSFHSTSTLANRSSLAFIDESDYANTRHLVRTDAARLTVPESQRKEVPLLPPNPKGELTGRDDHTSTSTGSDYTDDSGFTDARRHLKVLPEPVEPVEPLKEGSPHYYKKLEVTKMDAVGHYKKLTKKPYLDKDDNYAKTSHSEPTESEHLYENVSRDTST